MDNPTNIDIFKHLLMDYFNDAQPEMFENGEVKEEFVEDLISAIFIHLETKDFIKGKKEFANYTNQCDPPY